MLVSATLWSRFGSVPKAALQTLHRTSSVSYVLLPVLCPTLHVEPPESCWVLEKYLEGSFTTAGKLQTKDVDLSEVTVKQRSEVAAPTWNQRYPVWTQRL